MFWSVIRVWAIIVGVRRISVDAWRGRTLWTRFGSGIVRRGTQNSRPVCFLVSGTILVRFRGLVFIVSVWGSFRLVWVGIGTGRSSVLRRILYSFLVTVIRMPIIWVSGSVVMVLFVFRIRRGFFRGVIGVWVVRICFGIRLRGSVGTVLRVLTVRVVIFGIFWPSGIVFGVVLGIWVWVRIVRGVVRGIRIVVRVVGGVFVFFPGRLVLNFVFFFEIWSIGIV